MSHGHHEEGLVEIGCKDVALLREILALPHDVVLAVVDSSNQRRAFRINGDVDIIAHCHRVGAPYAFETEVAFNLRFYLSSVIGLYRVPASCVLDYQSMHSYQSGANGEGAGGGRFVFTIRRCPFIRS